MTVGQRIQKFAGEHPAATTIAVSAALLYVGIKLNNRAVDRAVAKTLAKTAEAGAEIFIERKLVQRLLEEGGRLVWTLDNPEPVSQIVLKLSN